MPPVTITPRTGSSATFIVPMGTFDIEICGFLLHEDENNGQYLFAYFARKLDSVVRNHKSYDKESLAGVEAVTKEWQTCLEGLQ